MHGQKGFRHGCTQIPRDLKELAILTLSLSTSGSTPEVSNRKGHCWPGNQIKPLLTLTLHPEKGGFLTKALPSEGRG